MFSQLLKRSAPRIAATVRNFTASANNAQVNTKYLWLAGATAVGGAVVYSTQSNAKAESVSNSAFVFIKPHAVTDKTKAMVSAALAAKGVKIIAEGSLTSEVIDEKKLIDQHYYAIASKATILKPDQLNVPEDKFKAQFGLEWKDALAAGKVFNALDACSNLGITADEMDTAWGACKKAKKLVKFGGGFYCGLVEIDGKAPIYVFNGFFMSMRSKFTAPGGQISYYVVEWDPAKLAWEDFRGKVLGPTDPADAPADSCRGMILADWEKLGLASVPNVGDNGVHASASPFEALAERNNWLSAAISEDPFGKALINAGVTEETIKKWSVDPQVMVDGKKGSLFDALEDMDSTTCIEKCVDIAAENGDLVFNTPAASEPVVAAKTDSPSDEEIFILLGGGAAAIGGVASACFSVL